MTTRFITPALVFMMKYFFDVEKEITRQILFTVHLRLIDCRDIIANLYHLAAAHR